MDERDALTPELLSEIEDRADAATRGPWKVAHHQQFDEYDVLADFGPGCGEGVLPIEDKPNAEFIAHAREDVPALIAEVRRLRADYETVRAQRSTALKSIEELQRRIDGDAVGHQITAVEEWGIFSPEDVGYAIEQLQRIGVSAEDIVGGGLESALVGTLQLLAAKLVSVS